MKAMLGRPKSVCMSIVIDICGGCRIAYLMTSPRPLELALQEISDVRSLYRSINILPSSIRNGIFFPRYMNMSVCPK